MPDFQVGAMAVYPGYGVAEITGIEDREISGTTQRFYVLQVLGKDTTLMVPMSKAESVGFHPRVILAGRATNDGMGSFVAAKTIKLLVERGRAVQGARVGVLGLTFKPNLADLRNSRVPDVVRELEEYAVDVLVHDPVGSPEEARVTWAR